MVHRDVEEWKEPRDETVFRCSDTIELPSTSLSSFKNCTLGSKPPRTPVRRVRGRHNEEETRDIDVNIIL